MNTASTRLLARRITNFFSNKNFVSKPLPIEINNAFNDVSDDVISYYVLMRFQSCFPPDKWA